MSTFTPQPSVSDVVIIGAGVIGLAHAVTALDQGLSVTVVERDERAVGASVRNFGHVCVSAQSRADQAIAQRSRKGWLSAAERAGIPVRQDGCVTVARTQTQLAVLEELHAERGDQVTMLTAEEVRERLGGLGSERIIGGAHMRDDLRVDPRTTVSRLSDWLQTQPGAEIRFRHAVREVVAEETGDGNEPTWRVRTSRGDVLGRRVIVCVGHDLDYLFPDIADEGEVGRCRLSMGRVVTPNESQVAPAVLTGSSMLRYGAFVEQPSAPELLAEARELAPQLLEIDANVMSTQLPDGTLIVGDSHDNELVAPPFMSEVGYDAILTDFADVLGDEPLTVVERWQGIYANSPRQDILHAQPAPGLDVVTVTAGIGMTMSFGIAARTFGEQL